MQTRCDLGVEPDQVGVLTKHFDYNRRINNTLMEFSKLQMDPDCVNTGDNYVGLGLCGVYTQTGFSLWTQLIKIQHVKVAQEAGVSAGNFPDRTPK